MLTKNNAVQPVQETGIEKTQDNVPVEEFGLVQKPSLTRVIFVTLVRGLFQIILMVAVLAGAYVGMNKLISSGEKPTRRPSFKTVYTVDTLTAELKDYRPIMTVYGETTASRTVDLRALVAGEVISVHPNLQIGEHVQAGEALLEVDHFNYEGALREAKANRDETVARIAEYQARIDGEKSKLLNLLVQLGLAEKDLQRIQSLRERGTSTQKQVDDRMLIVSQRKQLATQTKLNVVSENAKLDQQRAILARLKWRMNQAERKLRDTVLTAPFSGIISNAQVDVGKMLGANDVVVTIYQADKMDVRFTLTDQLFGRIQTDKEGLIGRKVKVVWVVGGEERVFPAVIDRIGAQISSAKGGIEVYATILGDMKIAGVRPGAFVEIRVPDKTYNAHVRMPESAVYNGNTIYVSVDGKLQRRAVKVSGYDGEYVLVGEGVAQGDKILTTRIAEISEGLAVVSESEAKAQKGKRGKGKKPENGGKQKPDDAAAPKGNQ
ncbi:MAG: efflux RND transporter periplasmic adaptor subunit [Rhizobiaceae bacterium]|nr:efflux RND transporter periplasmic adaptor subunit [Rhizobiaceae bacterium]MBL4697115.1 efflux RND transporter periplasmic adaptor subunit [Rhizobiaceae bacterium]